MKVHLDTRVQSKAVTWLDHTIAAATSSTKIAAESMPDLLDQAIDVLKAAATRVRSSDRVVCLDPADFWGDLPAALRLIDNVDWNRVRSKIEALDLGTGTTLCLNVEDAEFVRPLTDSAESQRRAAVRTVRLIQGVRTILGLIGKSNVRVISYQFPRVGPQDARNKWPHLIPILADVYLGLTDVVDALSPRAYQDRPTDSVEACAWYANNVATIARSVDRSKGLIAWVGVRTPRGERLTPEQAAGIVDGLRAGGCDEIVLFIGSTATWDEQDQRVLDAYMDAAGVEPVEV